MQCHTGAKTPGLKEGYIKQQTVQTWPREIPLPDLKSGC